MKPPKIMLHSLDATMTTAWREAFADVPEVEVFEGDILEGSADCIVSPGNSFGFMDGGIDLVYLRFFGHELQTRLQENIRGKWFGELAVGQATIVSTEHRAIPLLVCAPTMRVPDRIPTTINVYLAFRAALIAIVEHNRSSTAPIRSIKAPALGTGIGTMPLTRAAKQMRAGYASVFEEPRWLSEPSAILLHHEAMKSF